MTANSTITPELLDQLLANYEKAEDLTGDDGLFKQLKKALIERALGAELTQHLGYEKGDPAGRGSGRNGSSAKTVLSHISQRLLCRRHRAEGALRLRLRPTKQATTYPLGAHALSV